MEADRRWWAGALLAAAAACGTVGDKTVVISSGGDGDVLIPQLADQTQGRVYNELLFDKLADIGLAQNTLGDAGYEPRIASSWTWSRDSLSIAFHLDPRARWHDGRPVTAGDVRFAFAVLSDPKTASSAGAELARFVDSVSVGDSLTATVWYKARTPEQFHAVAYNLFPLPEHLLAQVPHDSLKTSAFAKAPVGNGPFRFVSWEQKRRLEMVAFDGYMLGRPKIDRLVFTITGSAQTAVRAVLAGDADFIEQLTFEDVSEAARIPDIRIIPARRYDYGILEFNTRGKDGAGPNAIFGNAGVRRALSMAVDRAALVRNVHDSLGVPGAGPFSRSQWSADTTLRHLAYDTAAAARLLDSLGWHRGPDGTRVRGGRPLAFSIALSNTSRPRVRYAELLQQAFASAGAKVTVDATDMQAFRDKLVSRKFDAVLFSWTATPSPSSARQTWSSRAFAKGSIANAGGWANAVFDAQLDSGLAAMDPVRARAHFSRAYQAALDDAPAIWMYEPMVVAAASRRLVTGPFRPDAWWASVRSWDVTGPRRSGGGKPNP